MAKRITSIMLVCCVVAAFAAPTLAGGRLGAPHRFMPGTDAELVQLVNDVNGQTWSAWTFRNGSETDIAITVTRVDDPSNSGRSSEPVFIGRDDRIDQVHPTLALDSNGSVYLAYAEHETGIVKLTALAIGADDWTPARSVSSRGELATAPALRIIGEGLVLAYSANDDTRIRQYRLIAPAITSGMSDGPDPNYRDKQPFPTEEDSGGRDNSNTLETPDHVVDIDATGLHSKETN